jgi:hypothetical protein
MGVLYCQWRGCRRKVLPFGVVYCEFFVDRWLVTV